MRVLALVGSHRKNGNTSQIVSLMEESLNKIAALHNEPMEIETLYLGHMDLRPCLGCRVCFDKGEAQCPQRDDLLEIKAKIKTADGIILASPVYVNDVSGLTKNFIDRMAHACHRPEFADKSVYLLATTGGSFTNHTLGTMNALRAMGFYVMGQAGFKTGSKMERGEMERTSKARIDGIAKKAYQDIREKKFRKPSFYSLMIFKMQQTSRCKVKAAENPLDYDYWKKQGWSDPHCNFFIPYKANALKVAFARLVGGILVKMML